MAEPRDAYPESATLGELEPDTADGERALREALAASGEEIAAAVERTDDVEDLLTTAILVLASADDDDVEHVTQSTANLIEAVDGLSTEGAAELATDLGDSADDLSATLETVLEIERAGHLDDLVRIATAFSGALSPEEVEELATMLEESGSEIVEALDVVLELQREDNLEDLVSLAETLSTLEIDEDTARGIDSVLSAVGEAERESEPVGLLGSVRELRTPDARAGLGYLVALLKAQGRRLRER